MTICLIRLTVAMIPIRMTVYLLLALWVPVVLMWLILSPYWKWKYMTDDRRREMEEGNEESWAKDPVNRVWHTIAIAVLLVLPLLFTVDALAFPLGLLYAPMLSLFPPFASAWQVAGAAIALLGVLIMLTVGHTLAREVFARTKEERVLMTSGLYTCIRHPFYLHFFLVPLGLLLLTLNSLSLFLVLFYTTFFGPQSLFRKARIEEAYLRERYGEEYAEWEERTGRFLPRFRR